MVAFGFCGFELDPRRLISLQLKEIFIEPFFRFSHVFSSPFWIPLLGNWEKITKLWRRIENATAIGQCGFFHFADSKSQIKFEFPFFSLAHIPSISFARNPRIVLLFEIYTFIHKPNLISLFDEHKIHLVMNFQNRKSNLIREPSIFPRSFISNESFG